MAAPSPIILYLPEGLWYDFGLRALKVIVVSFAAAAVSVAVDPVGAPAASPVRFVDVARKAGLNFVLNNGVSPEKQQIETMAGGLGVIDYNNDGLPDIFFANGARMPEIEKDDPRFHNRLFENKGDGTFVDVTSKAGVRGRGFCTGVAIADYDNDGWQDLFVACVPGNLLYRNRGDGTFVDVTKRAGLSGPFSKGQKLWSIAAGWLDYDNDGNLDLFISNYCDWSVDNNPACLDRRGTRFYCSPRSFKGMPNSLFRNNGNGTFTDVSVAAGISGTIGYGMGVAFADYNRDMCLDVFVANDTVRNLFFENDCYGKFREKALWTGVAFREDGKPISGMSADFRDFDNDGFPDLFMTALASETWPVYHNMKGKGFQEITFASGTGKYSVTMSGWCDGIYDFDNDGWKDLLAVGSHAMDNSGDVLHVRYPEPGALFLNLAGPRFRNASAEAGGDFNRPAMRRGCAFADFDGNGTIDVATSVIGAPAELFLNLPSRKSNWIGLRLIGRASNHDGIGAEVKIVEPSGRTQYNHVTTSVGYGSSSDRRVHFGLGATAELSFIDIRWPSGTKQELCCVPVNRTLKIEEEPSRCRLDFSGAGGVRQGSEGN